MLSKRCTLSIITRVITAIITSIIISAVAVASVLLLLASVALGFVALPIQAVAQSTSTLLSTAPPTVDRTLDIMPLPESVTLGDGSKFRFSTTQTLSVLGAPNQRLYPNATRWVRRLGDRINITFPQEHVLRDDSVANNPNAPFVLDVRRAAALELGEDESYTLRITASNVRITAETDLGAIRGIETLLQTLQSDTAGYYFPALTITDKPRFAWRGLLLDVCRHFVDFNHVKRIIDQMVLVKMNVLHWHLSEDQGFRVESKVYPRLHQFGSDGMYYTQEQIREIIRYADERGVRVMPEFDVPGHTGAWLVGHPELASGPRPSGGAHKIERSFGRNSSNMNPTLDTTYRFLDRFFGEMAALFPDKYFHIGGDEVSGRVWRESPQIQEFMKQKNFKTPGELQHYFNSRLRPIVQKHGKIMVGWDEIFEGDLPKDIVIHTWRNKDSLYRSVRAGHRGLLSWGYYIDLIHPAANHYLVDPIPNDTILTAEQAARVLGCEATMWSEYAPHETIDSRIWPRTAAIAERLWSPRTVNNVDDMYRRLDGISIRLEELGAQHERNYEMLLRRILNSNDESQVATIRNLVDFIEPVKEYQRGRYGFSTLMFFSDVIDAARPDAKGVRPFRAAVEGCLTKPFPSNTTETLTLRKQLETWRDNHAALTALIPRAPKLKATERMSLLLSSSATIALKALDYLQATNANAVSSQVAASNQTKPAKKLSKKLSKKAQEKLDSELRAKREATERAMTDLYVNAQRTFAEAKRPFARCELQIVGALERLVQSATQATLQALSTLQPLNLLQNPPKPVK